MEYILAGLGPGRTNDIGHVDAILESECDRRSDWICGASSNSSMDPGVTPPRACELTLDLLDALCMITLYTLIVAARAILCR